MSTWVLDDDEQQRPSWLQNLAVSALKRGYTPKHVAFIMDGNRRFARENGIQKIQGHSKGFEKLAEALRWCDQMDVREVTVYAFSIENFKRGQDEVDALMDLAREKFRRLLDEKDKFAEKGIRVRILGKLSLLPEDLQEIIRQAEDATRDNSKKQLNVAFAYTSREEITNAIDVATSECDLESSDAISSIENRLYAGGCAESSSSAEVDLLIRTSGEVRFSDFMLWQASSRRTVIHFTRVLWPDFTLWNFLAGVFHYQWHRNKLQSFNGASSIEDKKDKFSSDDVKALSSKGSVILDSNSNGVTSSSPSSKDSSTTVTQCIEGSKNGLWLGMTNS